MSLFTEKLRELAKYSAKVDKATITEKDVSALEGFRDAVYADRKYYTLRQRCVLRDTVTYLLEDAADVLRINSEVKAIEREIREQRLSARASA